VVSRWLVMPMAAMSLGPLKVAAVAVTGVTEGDRYAVGARLGAAGLPRALLDLTYVTETQGGLTGSDRTPLRYRETAVQARSGAVAYDVAVTWLDGVPQTTYQPAGLAAEVNLSPQSQAGTIDLGTALLKLLGDRTGDAPCQGDMRVFNGITAARLSLDRADPAADGMTCHGRYTHLGGLDMISTGERDVYRFALHFSREPDDLYRLASVEFWSDVGRLVFRRRGG
jgi:hypothetical protein